jgi:hypothetical protein
MRESHWPLNQPLITTVGLLSWQHTDLFEEAHHVLFRPLLGQFSVCDAVDGNRCHLEIIAGARRSGKITFVFAKGCETSDDPVTFRDLIFDLVITRSCLPEDFESLFQPLPALG